MNRALWRYGELLPSIPLHPLEWDSSQPSGLLDNVLAGVPGPFNYSIFGKRNALFLQQKVGFKGDTLSWLRFDFYERLYSPEELINATGFRYALTQRGFKPLDGSVPPPGMPITPILVSLEVTIFPSMYDAPDGIVPLPDQDERPIGNHIVMPIGFDSEYLFFQHNWGPQWGIRGLGCFSRDYLRRFQREAWSLRFLPGPCPEGKNISGGYLVPEDGTGPSGERLSRLLGHSWDGHGDSQFFMLREGCRINRAGRVDILGRWLIGIGDGSIRLQFLAILHGVEGGPFVAGWMHIRGTSSGSIVEELFIWPPYRKLGIGTTLAGQALLHASLNPLWPKNGWEWKESEADVMVLERSERKPHVPLWLKAVASHTGQMSQEAGKNNILEWLGMIANTQKKWT